MKICWMFLSMKRSRSCQKSDTSRDEMRKATNAREALDRQDTLVRRIIAGAYKVNAVYFFRNVDFQDTITLNPVDIVCALRPPLRRISVLHLILQNGRQLPRPLLQKLYDAIEDYNNIKQRDDQRPRWGIHMSEAHLIAIADTRFCQSWTCHTGSWQIKGGTESGTKVGQRSESESIINSTLENRRSCSSAKTSSSTSATEGWKRPRERWKILLTPWWRLESSRILWMGIQTINRFDLCIGPDKLGKVGQQSLLVIYLFFITNDFWEESEPANWEPHFFWISLHETLSFYSGLRLNWRRNGKVNF